MAESLKFAQSASGYCPNFVCNIRLVSWRNYNEVYCEKICVSQRYGRINGLIPAVSGKELRTHKDGFDRVAYQPARRNILNTFLRNSPNSAKDFLRPSLNRHNNYLSWNLSFESSQVY